MTRDEMVALTTRWRTALEKRNLGAYTLLYASDAAVESPLGGVVNTPARLRQAFETFFATFPDATFTFEVPCIDDTRAVLVAMMAGTHVGEISGLPASGKPFRLQIVFVLDAREGLIVRDRRIYDFTGLLVQIGVLKAKVHDH
jgi:steroid delta-isomerase-like uncharacterized protein